MGERAPRAPRPLNSLACEPREHIFAPLLRLWLRCRLFRRFWRCFSSLLGELLSDLKVEVLGSIVVGFLVEVVSKLYCRLLVLFLVVVEFGKLEEQLRFSWVYLDEFFEHVDCLFLVFRFEVHEEKVVVAGERFGLFLDAGGERSDDFAGVFRLVAEGEEVIVVLYHGGFQLHELFYRVAFSFGVFGCPIEGS